MYRFVSRLSLIFIFILIVTVLYALPVLATELAVELVWNFKDAGWVQIQIEEGFYELKYDTTPYQFPVGSSMEMGWGGWAPVIRLNYKEFHILRNTKLELMSKAPEGVFRIRTPDGKTGRYRGGLIITWAGGCWQFINKVKREDYLKGVVPIEMSNHWAKDGLEALKAQAVAARTFMVKKAQSGRVLTDSPDIDQAYLGKEVEGDASIAVEATEGEILADAQTKHPIDAYYSSHNGGYTEVAEHVWANRDVHYSSHPDPYSEGVGGAAGRWRFIISAEALGKTFDLGPVRKVELDKFPSGRVKKVRIVDITDKSKELPARTFVKAYYPFGQPIHSQAFLGNFFDVEFYPPEENLSSEARLRPVYAFRFEDYKQQNRPGPSLARIISSAQGISPELAARGTFIFIGRGWGHGVGMSQWGAYHMAQLGYTYKEILSFYYDNSVIIRAY